MLEVDRRPDRKIIDVQRIDDVLLLYTNYGKIKLEPKASNIVRILYTLRDNFVSTKKPGVIYSEKYIDWSYKENTKEVKLYTEELCLCISKESSSIRYYNNKGQLLLSEREYESKNLEEFSSYKIVEDENVKIERITTPDGIKEVVKDATKVFDKNLYKTRLYLKWNKDEYIYGIGQQEEGYLNLRGTTQYVHQANLKISIPFIISNQGYGILMDTYGPMIFNDSNYGSYLYTEADLEMDYYFMYGKNMDGVIKCYRILTGKATMLPKWAFGFMQSQERYETAEEIQHIISEYRKRKIGLDCIVLDWHSWEGELWGQKTFDKNRFPDPAKMINTIYNNNIAFMISIWPNMHDQSENYKEFKENNLLLPNSSIYNAYDEEGRNLFWKQTYEGLFQYGIDAWWCDSSEPFTPEWNHEMKPEPSAMYQEFYDTCKKYIPAEYTNGYGLMHAKTIYEGQRKHTNEKRVINLTRNGYTGQQRYGTILWSGDICASWETLKKQIVAGLNLSVCGLPYWTLDIGAFFVKKGRQWFWNGGYEQGYKDLGYKELFTRWFQFGCFLPIFRSHGTDFRRELWNFGDKGDMFYDTLIKFNQLRYQLMPYIYSMAGKVWKDDYTMLRMLAFDYPEDNIACGIDDQYIFGESLMVCPVTTPMYYDVDSKPIEGKSKKREVYLPSGAGWYDFWTGEYYQGGQIITSDAPIKKIPLFVKEGSIIPKVQVMEYVDQITDAPIDIHVYSGKDTVFELYDDKGNGYDYENGEFAITKLVWKQKQENLEICDPEGAYNEMIKIRVYNIHIYNTDSKYNN